MTLPVSKILKLGTVNGAIYDFVAVGDILPMHDHDEATVHFTVVCRGAVKISGPDWSQNNRAGDILDFAAGNPHEFEALEPATRIVNIIKGLRA